MQSHHIVSSIDEVLVLLKADVPENPFLVKGNQHEYMWIRDGERIKLVPSVSSQFWSPFLYRGQTKRYVPCLPGVFRGMPLLAHPQELSRRDRAKCLLFRARLEEFLSVLAKHPATEFAHEMQLVTYPEAIAQHYEIFTDRIDLSQDPEVAAFFATNERSEDGRWYPKKDGIGVLYRLNFPRFQKALEPSPFNLEWIGRQALPRPGEQRAWTFPLPLGRDFESFPVDVFTFNHMEPCARRLNDKFEGGRLLFPPDILSEVAEEIKECKSIARSLVVRVLAAYGCKSDEQERELHALESLFCEEFGVSVADRELICMFSAQLVRAQFAIEELKSTFTGGVWAVREVEVTKEGTSF